MGKEFVDELHKIQSRDTRTTLTFIALGVGETQKLGTETQGILTEQSLVLDKHGELLSQMNAKLSKLEEEAFPSAVPSDRAAPRLNNFEVVGPKTLKMPLRTPRGTHPDTAVQLARELEGIACHAQELADIKGGIVRRVEEQVALLNQHVGLLKVIGEAGAKRLPLADQERVGDRCCRLEANLCSEIPGMLRNIEVILEDGAAVLGRNSDLISSIAQDLGCDVCLADFQGKLQPKDMDELGFAYRNDKRRMSNWNTNLQAMAAVKRSKESGTKGGSIFSSCACVQRSGP